MSEISNIQLENLILGIKDETARNELKKKVTILRTVHEMVESNVSVGDVIQTLGYNEEYDRGGSHYVISDETETVNGASVIKLNNGLYAKMSASGGITPQMFGIVGNESEVDSNRKWNSYLEYVHSKPRTHFELTSPSYITYQIYKPLIFQRSVVGEKTSPNPSLTYMSSVVGTMVADSSGETDMYGFTYNVKSFVNFKTVNDGDVTEISNFTINCTNDSSVVAMDYGLYVPETTRCKIEGIRVNEPNRIGIYVLSTWVSSMRNCEVFGSKYTGFCIGHYDPDGGQHKTGTSTSFDMSSLYVNGGNEYGYIFYGLQYSDLSSLACDSVGADSLDGAMTIYTFELCKGLTLNSLAMESIKARYLIRFDGCGGITINSPYFLSCAYSESIIIITNPVERYNGSFSINNPSFIDGISGYNNVSNSYFFNTTSLIIFNGDSTMVKLNNGGNVYIEFGANQKEFIENTKESVRRLYDGQWEYTSFSSSADGSNLNVVDVSSQFSGTQISGLEARRCGNIVFVKFQIPVTSGWGGETITTTLKPLCDTVLSVHRNSGADSGLVASAVLTQGGGVTTLSEGAGTILVSGMYFV